MKRFVLSCAVLGGLLLGAAVVRGDEPVTLLDTPAGKQCRDC